MAGPHRERIRVEWSDTDASGRIHNTAPLRWAERAEHAMLRSAGLSALPNLLRRRIEVEYLLPLTFTDEVELELRVDRVGTTSLTYGWTGLTERGPAFTGTSVVVHIGDDGRPAPLTAQLRAAMDAAGENQSRGPYA